VRTIDELFSEKKFQEFALQGPPASQSGFMGVSAKYQINN
jgi:hypothetical protein